MSSGSMPELLQEVTGHLVSVEEGLAALDHHKTALHNHAQMVKSEISSAVERQMAALRNKEKQLIRQVEVASTHLNCEVNVTQAQLLQHKGALAVTRTFLDNCSITAPNSPCTEDSDYSARFPCNTSRLERASSECRGSVCGRDSSASSNNTVVSTVRNTIATTVNSMPHHDVAGLLQHTEKLLRVPLVSVSLEESSLSSAIQKFGRVSSPPTLSHSELLPQCLEEYGDAEHHVLHKSVVRPDAPLPPIDVRRPYLLAAKKNTINISAAVAASGEYHGNGGALPIPASAGVKRVDEKEDLVKWLHRMQLDTSHDSSADTERQQRSAHSKVYSELCVEEACQANESCAAFSSCLLAGQCRKSAMEKVEQSAKWRQQQLVSCTRAEEPVPFLLHPKLVIASSRKRQLSDTTSSQAARNVIAHMTDILSSGNGSWLLHNPSKELCNSINELNFVQGDSDRAAVTAGFCHQENSGLCCSTPRSSNNNNHEAVKKLKVCHGVNVGEASDVAINNRLNSLRSAILYRAPYSDSWVLPAAAAGPLPGSAATQSEAPAVVPVSRVPVFDAAATDVVDKTTSWDGAANVWLLPVRGDAPLQQVSVKKANCDKENNLCRASMKSQLSLVSMESMENLKERVDRLITDASDKQHPFLSDLEEKELWLLQQCPSIKADNKVLDQVMKEKCEWLSNSSLSSFSIISDPECSRNSWLMSEQL